MKENGFIEIDFPKGHNAFIYIYEGKIILDGLGDIDKSTAFFPKDEKKITISSDEEARILLISGKPHNRRIKLKGSFVE